MKITVYQDRRLLNEDNNFGSENENLATTLVFEFPEYIEKDGTQISTKDLNKTIIFDIEGDNELPIYNDKFSFPYEITKLGEVVWNICLKEKSETEDMTDKLVWYSETMKTRFINTLEGRNEITTQKIDAFNVITSILNEKIAEVETLKVDIGDYKAALDNKVDKEQGKGLSTNDFTNILKEKLEKLENYNDEEIRDLLNGSLKNVNYTASNGMLTFTKNDGSTLSVDLPLELLIESGRYDEANKQIVLVLANGNSINIPVSSLLDDFYGKGETYNKTEVDTLISQKQKQIEALEQEIDDLIEENQKQQEGLDILNSEYTEKELEGETVVISNGLPKSKISVIGNGNSYQETTEGYNSIDTSVLTNGTYHGLDCTFEDNVISVNGTYDKSSAVAIPIDLPFNLKKSGTYRLTIFPISGTRENTTIGLQFLNSSRYQRNYMQLNGTATTVTKEIDISEIAYVMLYLSGTGAVYTDFKFKIMLSEGTENKPYEPYTNGVATPNTDHKQDIEVIEAYNKFNKDDEQLETNKGRYHMSGNRLGNPAYSYLLIENIKPNTDYYYNGVVSASTSNVVVFDFYNDDEYISCSYYSKENGKTTTPSNCNKMYVSIPYAEKDTFQITENKDLPYLPYGHIGLVQKGIQLLDYTKAKHYSGGSPTLIDNGFILNAENADKRIVYFKVDLKANKSYIIDYSSEKISGTATKANVYLPKISQYPQLNKAFTPTSDTDEIGIYVDLAVLPSVFNVTNIRLYEAKYQDKPYEPYIEPIVHSIDLAGNSLALVNEVDKDKLIIGTDGSCRIDKNINSHKCSSEDISAMVSNNRLQLKVPVCSDRYILPNNFYSLNIDKPYIYSNIAKSYYGKPLSQLGTIESGDFVSLWNSNSAGIMFRFNDITTLEDAKAYFDNNDVYLMYKKAETEVIELPSIEPIKLIEGITNIFELVTNLGTTLLAVTYKVSNKARLEALENAILSLGGNV